MTAGLSGRFLDVFSCRASNKMRAVRHPLARVNQCRASINKRLPASINIGIIISAATSST
jgi:hypothetical protein